MGPNPLPSGPNLRPTFPGPNIPKGRPEPFTPPRPAGPKGGKGKDKGKDKGKGPNDGKGKGPNEGKGKGGK